ncbi:hypothetical protein G5714_000795 [Onychostoma macrolepis]|uniref:Uncharacterized protein n=1 Tax=Onychostoma macrolepis TaxID=369639 RepID=A0A7J6DIV5_9TELE|nr:hypothetical protein G5714_000795 [Onychostoma macrolepis]
MTTLWKISSVLFFNVKFLTKVTAEFQRITTVQLEPKFMSSLDLHTPKLLTLFRAKGGVLGQRLKTEMELLKDEHCSVDMKREVVIRCMTEFLGEHAGDLIKEFNVCHLNFNIPDV